MTKVEYDPRITLLELFNDLLNPDVLPPKSWRRTRLTVIFKAGGSKLQGNYRPIAIIPLIYKVFSRMVASRLALVLEREQSVDQTGFKKLLSCIDQLFTTVQLIERCRVWG